MSFCYLSNRQKVYDGAAARQGIDTVDNGTNGVIKQEPSQTYTQDMIYSIENTGRRYMMEQQPDKI